VGHARVNFAMLAGVAVADQFLESYQKHTGRNFAYDPYWDIISLLDIRPLSKLIYEVPNYINQQLN